MSGNSEMTVSAATAPAMTADGVAPPMNYNGMIVFICMAQLVVTIDTAVMGIVLPSITLAFPGDSEGLTWVAATSTLTFASLLMLGGRLSDLIRAERYAASSVWRWSRRAPCSAALAPNIVMLIAARALLGVGLATVMPANFSLLNGVLPAGPIRHRAFGWFVAVAGAALIFGYVLGGSVVTLLGWRAAFLIAPPGVIGAVIAARYIPTQTAPRVKQPVDLLGAFLVVLERACWCCPSRSRAGLAGFPPRRLAPRPPASARSAPSPSLRQKPARRCCR